MLRLKDFLLVAIGLAPSLVAAQASESRVAQSWNQAVVYLPGASTPSSIEQIKTEKPHPVAIFMHGCGGIGDSNFDNHAWAKLLASQGLLVVMPDSLARTDRQPSCDPRTGRGGLFPPVHDMRLEEIKYAADQIRKHPWFDGKNLFLMGFSEGAMAATRTTLSGFRGVIVSSWTCTHTKAPSFDGVFLPTETPLLTLSHEDESWFGSDPFRGHCAAKIFGRTDARHVTIPGRGHGTYHSEQARQAVLQFVQGTLQSQ